MSFHLFDSLCLFPKLIKEFCVLKIRLRHVSHKLLDAKRANNCKRFIGIPQRRLFWHIRRQWSENNYFVLLLETMKLREIFRSNFTKCPIVKCFGIYSTSASSLIWMRKMGVFFGLRVLVQSAICWQFKQFLIHLFVERLYEIYYSIMIHVYVQSKIEFLSFINN